MIIINISITISVSVLSNSVSATLRVNNSIINMIICIINITHVNYLCDSD